MTFGVLYNVASGALINYANAARTQFDPNASAKEKFDAGMSAVAGTMALMSQFGNMTAGGNAYLGGVGLGVAGVTLASNLGSALDSYSKYNANPTDANYNDLFQNSSGLMSALGGAALSAGVLAGNPYMVGTGLYLETLGNAMKEANKYASEHPTELFDPFFEIAEHLLNAPKRIWDGVGDMLEDISSKIAGRVSDFFDDARAWRQAVDPLMLDLDGDGLELKRADGTVLFDHNADGIRTGTGWINSDDGILVRDLNGDGSITSGRELFGADTLKLNGQLATNGFDALADLDFNHDGNFTSADAAWSSVKVWRDLDQDGVSDAGELFTLDALGISRIGVVGSATNTTGGTQAGTTVNANLIAQSASFTQTVDGAAATDRTVGTVDLENNPFYREFTTHVPVTAQAAALPNMQGSGRARDLDESASASPLLATRLSVYNATTTRDAQRAQLDGLITEWAKSSAYWSSIEDNLGGEAAHVGLNFSLTGMSVDEYRNLIGVLEVFNGERFYALPTSNAPLVAGVTITSSSSASGGVTVLGTNYNIAPPAAQLTLLQQSYDALKESIYGTLVMQTRLKPYLDSIELTIDANGIGFDTTALAAKLESAQAGQCQGGLDRSDRTGSVWADDAPVGRLRWIGHAAHLGRWPGQRFAPAGSGCVDGCAGCGSDGRQCAQ